MHAMECRENTAARMHACLILHSVESKCHALNSTPAYPIAEASGKACLDSEATASNHAGRLWWPRNEERIKAGLSVGLSPSPHSTAWVTMW
jgi:hypothetical protein